MKRNEELFYQAVMARDSRFDGKFFVGVKTTGIYCRPICPAKPKKENIEFFPNALAAEQKGFRPCLRCRPESAPLSAVWMGKSAVVQRALKLIALQSTAADSTIDHKNEEKFAEIFGLSARHLRRLFQEELRLTPKQILDHHRLNLARKLILETNLPFTEIAFTSGYASIRRFNDAIQNRFKRTPTELRGKKKNLEDGISLKLSFRPPFDWNSLLHYYESHRIVGIETVTDQTYSRVFKMDNTVGMFQLELHPSEINSLKLSIFCDNPKYLGAIVQKVRAMFDLDSDPLLIANAFQHSKLLTRLMRSHPGLRLPRAWDAYEACVCTLLGQLVSITQAGKLVHQLIQTYGQEILHPISGEKIRLFPKPEIIAKAKLTEIGTTEARKDALRELSARVVSKKISLDSTQDPNAFREALLEIKGMGPWTAEYISLRALGDTNAFPGSDLILKRALDLYPDHGIENTQPWRAYGAIYLWKEFAKTLSGSKRKKS
jgi:AraC family transcriptional regulator of adaptative response / DNA-3-methyladenine glycosylase II